VATTLLGTSTLLEQLWLPHYLAQAHCLNSCGYHITWHKHTASTAVATSLLGTSTLLQQLWLPHYLAQAHCLNSCGYHITWHKHTASTAVATTILGTNTLLEQLWLPHYLAQAQSQFNPQYLFQQLPSNKKMTVHKYMTLLLRVSTYLGHLQGGG